MIETIITIVIMSILIGLVFQIFVIVGRIAVFVQGQKGIHNEIIYITQTIQNLVDDQNILLDPIEDIGSLGEGGFDQLLRFTESQASGLRADPRDFIIENICESGNSDCYLALTTTEDDGIGGIFTGETRLTDVDTVEVTNFYIKYLPNAEESDFSSTMHDGFWLFLDVRVPYYDEDQWWFKVSYQLQLFFNMRKY